MKRPQNHTNEGGWTNVDDYSVLPGSQPVTWRHPVMGVAYSQPDVLRIEKDGFVTEIPIRDYTRIGMLLLGGAAALVTLLGIWMFLNRRRKSVG